MSDTYRTRRERSQNWKSSSTDLDRDARNFFALMRHWVVVDKLTGPELQDAWDRLGPADFDGYRVLQHVLEELSESQK
jgi:hypothetical protein